MVVLLVKFTFLYYFSGKWLSPKYKDTVKIIEKMMLIIELNYLQNYPMLTQWSQLVISLLMYTGILWQPCFKSAVAVQSHKHVQTWHLPKWKDYDSCHHENESKYDKNAIAESFPLGVVEDLGRLWKWQKVIKHLEKSMRRSIYSTLFLNNCDLSHTCQN